MTPLAIPPCGVMSDSFFVGMLVGSLLYALISELLGDWRRAK